MKTEPSEKGNPHLAARRAAKAALLPRAAQLAGEGRTYREIADTLGIAKSTVCQWLRGRPLGRAAAKALGTPGMTAKLAARYESLYQRALREWNRSKADRRTQTIVTSEPAGGGPTTTTTVRTEPRTGNAACLGKALAAMKAMEGLHCRERSWRERFESEDLQAIEARIDAAEEAADEEACAALKAQAVAAEEKLRIAEARLGAHEHAAPACSPAIAPNDEGGEAAGRAHPLPLSRKESGANDTGSARSANGSPAETPRNRRKSFLPNDLHLPGFDFAGVCRSATLPNEVFQKGGAGKGRKKAKGGRRKPVSPPAQESAPRRGSAATLMRELDRVFKKM